jgi:hypothetical protein
MGHLLGIVVALIRREFPESPTAEMDDATLTSCERMCGYLKYLPGPIGVSSVEQKEG